MKNLTTITNISARAFAFHVITICSNISNLHYCKILGLLAFLWCDQTGHCSSSRQILHHLYVHLFDRFLCPFDWTHLFDFSSLLVRMSETFQHYCTVVEAVESCKPLKIPTTNVYIKSLKVHKQLIPEKIDHARMSLIHQYAVLMAASTGAAGLVSSYRNIRNCFLDCSF